MKEKYHIIGLMSGTSLDGLDMVAATFSYTTENQWEFHIDAAATYAYSSAMLERLKTATALSGLELMLLDNDLGVFFSEKIAHFIRKNNLHQHSIDAIASHGHTIFHQPEKNLTLQIGNGAIIAAHTALPTIYNFRVSDVAHGGQGAPLVPIGDVSLFADVDVCVNLGGIANLTYVANNKAIAFDVSPCNMVLNKLANKVGKPYDDSGCLAQTGEVNKTLLTRLNQLNYYQQAPPKSLGIEWVTANIFPVLESFDQLPIADLLSTFSAHIAQQLTAVFPKESKSVLVTGGGVWNKDLIRRIAEESNKKIIVPHQTIVDYKEALIFAFLGVKRLRNEVNCLSSVTGAKKDNVGGIIALP